MFTTIVFTFKNSLILFMLLFLVFYLSKKLNLNLSSSKTFFLILLLVFQLIGDTYRLLNKEIPEIVNKISLTIISIFIILVLSSLINGIIKAFLKKEKIETGKFLFDLINAIIYITGALLILKYIYSLNLTPFLATSAVLTIIIGLAVQDTIGNFIAGISFHFDDSIKIGDWVEVEGNVGKIVDLTWRAVKIRTHDKRTIVIPNQNFTKKEFTNLSFDGAKTHFKIGVSYNSEPSNVVSTIKKALLSIDGVSKNTEPEVFIDEFSDFSIVYRVAFGVKNFEKLKQIESKAKSKIFDYFKKEGIEIPYPIMNIYHKEKKEKELEDINISTNEIKKFPIIKEFPDDLIKKILKYFKRQIYEKNDVIIFEGEANQDLYLILDGKVSVFKNKKKISEVEKGDIFGEISLFLDEPRSATCIAEEKTVVLKIKGEKIKEILKENIRAKEELEKIVEERISNSKEVDEKIKTKFLEKKDFLRGFIKKILS